MYLVGIYSQTVAKSVKMSKRKACLPEFTTPTGKKSKIMENWLSPQLTPGGRGVAWGRGRGRGTVMRGEGEREFSGRGRGLSQVSLNISKLLDDLKSLTKIRY